MGFSRGFNNKDDKVSLLLLDQELSHHHHQQEEEEEIVEPKEEDEEEEKTKLLGTPFMSTTKGITFNNNNNQTPNISIDHHHHHHNHHQIIPNYGINMQSSSSSSIGNFISKDMTSTSTTTNHGAYDLGELDQALFLYLDGQQDHHTSSSSSNHVHHQDQLRHHNTSGMRPPTLNIFPSQPMHVEPSSTKASPGLLSGSQASISGSKRLSDSNNNNNHPLSSNMELVNNSTNNSTTTCITRNVITTNTTTALSGPEPATNKAIKREGNRKGPTSSSEQEGPKTPDPKTLRRLAQNREAARKSRLRKKAYVQQLESSRIKLTQIEQELQRARSQGMFFGGGGSLLGGEQGIPVGINNLSSDAAFFDMEYARWLEEHHRLMCELRAAVQEHIAENELRVFVDNCLAHYDQILGLKSMVAKTDVFHLVSGMWKTPAERCFMWMGGFRPSELIKIILGQIEPLSEQQILGICGLQQSTQEAEEALSQGLEALNQSLSDTITSDSLSCPPNMGNYMGQMALAMNKLSTLEGFVRQADNLRHQTIHRLHQILTIRQAARCLLAIAEYFHRLRALSSLWLARPRQDQ